MGALCIGGALTAACGQILGLDAIDYDVADGQAALTGPDGAAELDGNAGTDAVSPGADGSTLDQASPPGDGGPPPLDGTTGGLAPITIATGPSGSAVKGVAVDATRVYWVTGGASGSVLSVLKDGGAMTTIASGQASPLDIAVQGTSVYWSVTPAGAGPQCMAMVTPVPGSVAAGGDAGASCLVSSPDVTVRMTLGGASVVLLAQGTAAMANNEYVGVAAAGGVFTNTQTGGPSAAVTATAQKAFLGNQNGFHVDALTLTGLTFGPIVCTTNCGGTQMEDITTDVSVDNVIWITKGAGVFIAPIAVSGSTGKQLVTIPGASGVRVARDASWVYFTSVGTSVYAVPIAPGTDAGAYVTLSSAENTPYGIAVDESAVYWGDAEGRIRRVAVP